MIVDDLVFAAVSVWSQQRFLRFWLQCQRMSRWGFGICTPHRQRRRLQSWWNNYEERVWSVCCPCRCASENVTIPWTEKTPQNTIQPHILLFFLRLNHFRVLKGCWIFWGHCKVETFETWCWFIDIPVALGIIVVGSKPCSGYHKSWIMNIEHIFKYIQLFHDVSSISMGFVGQPLEGFCSKGWRECWGFQKLKADHVQLISVSGVRSFAQFPGDCFQKSGHSFGQWMSMTSCHHQGVCPIDVS